MISKCVPPVYYSTTEQAQVNKDGWAKKMAAKLNAHHFRTCAGFYGILGGRFFLARANGDMLEVSPDFGITWQPAPPAFRDHNGRALTI